GADQLGEQRRTHPQAHADTTAVGLELRAGVTLERDPLPRTKAEAPLARLDPGTATQLDPEGKQPGCGLDRPHPRDTRRLGAGFGAGAHRLQQLATVGPLHLSHVPSSSGFRLDDPSLAAVPAAVRKLCGDGSEILPNLAPNKIRKGFCLIYQSVVRMRRDRKST